jgi:hypothetical protein
MAAHPARPLSAARPADAVAYIYLMLQELEPMARDAAEADLTDRLKAAKAAAAEALARRGQSGA